MTLYIVEPSLELFLKQIYLADKPLPIQLLYPSTDVGKQNSGKLPFLSIYFLTQRCEKLKLQNSTKFLAKKYMDLYLSLSQTIQDQNLHLISLTCMRVAIKFNEVDKNAQAMSIEKCLKLSQGKYSEKQFLECQICLIKFLNFKFRITTPYDFLEVKSFAPQEQKLIKALQVVIDLAVSMGELRSRSSEQIFFGALLFSKKNKKSYDKFEMKMKESTRKWGQSLEVSRLIEEKVKQLLE